MDEAHIVAIGSMVARARSIHNRTSEWMLLLYTWSLFGEDPSPECRKELESTLSAAGNLLADLWDGLATPTLDAYVGWVRRFDALCEAEERAEKAVLGEWNRFAKRRGSVLRFPGVGP